MSTPTRIGAVVLTYNSTTDLPACLDGLLAQENIELYLIVVDNASAPEARLQMEADFVTRTNGVILDVTEATPIKIGTNHAIFIRNNRNAGYSAGNNIGARFAVELGCEAVLIINPDVRCLQESIIQELYNSIKCNDKCALVGPVVIGPCEEVQSPMYEPSFIEEIIFPFIKILFKRTYEKYLFNSLNRTSEHIVHKIHGCCFMIRSSFLLKIDFLDENTFLYCEEAIISEQAKNTNTQVMLNPKIQVKHMHKQKKGDFKKYSKSRLYFLKKYKQYGHVRIFIIYVIHVLINVKRTIVDFYKKKVQH